MLKKQNRLARVDNSLGKSFSSKLFNIKISKEALKEPKFAFVVSKKISKSAVKRNRTKRILQSVIEQILENVSKENKVVIYSKKELSFEQKEEVLRNIKDIFAKAKILKK
jgi:ribonuclease P protein component